MFADAEPPAKVKLLNVFAPVIVRASVVVEVFAKEKLWYVCPPRLLVVFPLTLMELLMVEVPAKNVRLVEFVKITGVVPERVSVLAPKLIVRTLALVDDKVSAVTGWPAVLNVPFVTVSVFDPMFNPVESPSCTVPP